MGRFNFFILSTLFLLAGIEAAAQSGNLEFVENKGQWNPRIQFKGQLSAGAFFLEKNGFTVVQHDTADLRRFYEHFHGHESLSATTSGKTTVKEGRRQVIGSGESKSQPGPDALFMRSHAYQMRFEGGNEQPEIVPEKPTSDYVNYFIGNDPGKWASHVNQYQAINYRNVYPGTDVRYYTEYGQLKYDFILQPGADFRRIKMSYAGQDKLQIKKGALIISTSVGEIKELIPYCYQPDPVKGRQEIKARYVLLSPGKVGFSIENYNPALPLIIDPSIIFCSYTGSAANQWGFTATPGPDGSLYSGGVVFGSGFPVSPGAYQMNFAGGTATQDIEGVDIGIFKFSPNGSARLYATYLGGKSNEIPTSLICDASGNLIVLGRTYSSDYPGTLVGSGGMCDILVTKFNASGSNLIGSLRIGGRNNDGVNTSDEFGAGIKMGTTYRFYGDDSRSEVILDNANNIYVAAQSQGDDFPTTAGVFQPAFGGQQDGVVLKINPTCTGLTWASYLGGQGTDGAFVISLDPANQDLLVAGATTTNTNFPGIVAGVYQNTYQGGLTDGYVSRISNDGSTLRRSSYLGTPAFDAIYGIQFDRNGRPYIMGVTEGNWPVINAGYSNPNSKQFVAKLKNDLSGFDYSTTFGNGSQYPNISPVAFLVDRCENVYISGWGGWIYPGQDGVDRFKMSGTAGMPVTPDARKSVSDNRDFYFIVLKKDASALLYGSFFGQDGGTGEHVDGGTSRFDEQGAIYQAICANCDGSNRFPITNAFPTTPGVWSTVNPAARSGGCNLAAVKIAFNFAGVSAGPKAFIGNSPDSIGCAPATFEFRDTVMNAKSYIWNYGDGTIDTSTNATSVTHQYINPGFYRIMLVAIDSTTCNIRDTAYINVSVRSDQASVAFNPVKLQPCDSLSYQFDNLSVAPAGKPFGLNSFIWDFGDGTRVGSGPNPIRHYYTASGTYNVKLILTDTNYCNAPDSVAIDLRIAPLVDAQFNSPSIGCAPYQAYFENVSEAGQQFIWDFGDGTGSTEVSPSHLYNNPGTYRIKLTVIDSATCNIIDSTEQVLQVYLKPTAAFAISPATPQENSPTTFINQSLGAVRYKWLFGDGDSTERSNMDTVMHQYNSTGTYNACLVAYNQYGCTDTACMPVQAVVVPVLDVPNAFTPGRNGKNSIVKVEGFGIGRMSWKIYNHWGQVVFESNDRNIGWDGTFKGQLQPMDVYAYTLDVEFTDGTKARKTGDITLIR